MECVILCLMNFLEAKDDFKDKLIKNNYKFVSDNKKSLVFRLGNSSFSDKFKITENEIKEYLKYLDDKKNYNNFLDYGFYNCEVCEHKVESRLYYRSRHRFFDAVESEKQIVFSDPKNKKHTIKIGSCSLNYFFYLINLKEPLRSLRPLFLHFFSEKKETFTLKDILNDIMTIQFDGFDFKDLKTADNYYRQEIYDCFFELSLLKDIHIKLEEKSNGIIRYKHEKSDKKNLEIPKLHYKDEVVKHYLMAIGDNHPILSYLSYYQVLEGYFLLASNEELISSVKKELKDPRFDIGKTNSLMKLINIVKTDKFNGRELDQLNTVLKRYIDFKKSKDFINEIEKSYFGSCYTGEIKIFNEDLKINVGNEKDFIISLAERIYSIRCALVHAKEDFSFTNKKTIKYIPSVKNEECISKELPLMRFLAEEILINAAIKD